MMDDGGSKRHVHKGTQEIPVYFDDGMLLFFSCLVLPGGLNGRQRLRYNTRDMWWIERRRGRGNNNKKSKCRLCDATCCLTCFARRAHRAGFPTHLRRKRTNETDPSLLSYQVASRCRAFQYETLQMSCCNVRNLLKTVIWAPLLHHGMATKNPIKTKLFKADSSRTVWRLKELNRLSAVTQKWQKTVHKFLTPFCRLARLIGREEKERELLC